MIVDNTNDFINAVKHLNLANKNRACLFPKQLMLIQPYGLEISPQSAQDNHYMQTQLHIDTQRALRQHAALVESLRKFLPIKTFRGQRDCPDDVFPNNAFATANQQLILGAMHQPNRQKETERNDIIDWFKKSGYKTTRLNTQAITAELTGSLVIDHSRNIGFCGLSKRCNREGAYAMHKAFGLDLTYIFDLDKKEYHTNVIMSVLAGRALMIHPDSFKDPNTAQAILDLYTPHVTILSDTEKSTYSGNSIAINANLIWLSKQANENLSCKNKSILTKAGFQLQDIDLSEIEKAGGSLRCCIMEIF